MHVDIFWISASWVILTHCIARRIVERHQATHMEARTKDNAATCPATPVRALLYCVELVEQLLEVKLESFFTYPVFLRYAMQHVKSMRAIDQLTEMGERLLAQVKTLQHVVSDLGAPSSDDMLPRSSHAVSEALTSLTFQEELSISILDACQTCILGNWKDSPLRSSVIGYLLNIRSETEQHMKLLQKLFADRQPLCRDAVLERFRITTVP